MKNFVSIAIRTSLALSLATAAFGQNYSQVNLVSNTAGIAPVTDSTLINPWGLARSTSSPWWVSDNGSGLSTLYNGAGAKQSLVVTIPKSDPSSTVFPTGTPTGMIFNGAASDFLIFGKPAVFIFATIDGTISAWNPAVGVAAGATPPSTHAVIAVKTTDGSVYTGLTSAFVGGKHFLYAANSSKGRVDVYDNTFNPVSLPREKGAAPAFTDSELPPTTILSMSRP
ncbi:TIGR03118 family protein [Tunturiibacter gelidiferens]|uniref:TIGR03118 family protein n=1 Tax=Tunturiibacter gelidiferens TaxID=3069689 RepID=UPI003D9B956F